jgi:hypothetical protein
VLAKQVLYHLSHATSLFNVLVIFLEKVSYFCLGLALDLDLPIYASHIARIIIMNHYLKYIWPHIYILNAVNGPLILLSSCFDGSHVEVCRD